MDRREMQRLVEIHVGAEGAGDIARAVSVYTDDIEHDVVGAPGGPLIGPAAAMARYEALLREIDQDELTEVRSYYGDDFCVVEHETTCRVVGQFAGIPGQGRRVTFRILHVFEFRDGAISRENVWMDSASVLAQLTAPAVAATAP